MYPLLFNLMADSLSVLLNVGVDKDHIKSVLVDLLPRGISHVQYADDTMILIDGSERSILNFKLILYCFEWLSGLQNFHKKERMANMLNCDIGTFPMKYLGIPISDCRLKSIDFGHILEKLKKKWTLGKEKNICRLEAYTD